MTDVVPARVSLRSRGAAPVSTYTLRPISALIPAERASGQALPRMTPEAAMAMYVACFIAHAWHDARTLADEVG